MNWSDSRDYKDILEGRYTRTKESGRNPRTNGSAAPRTNMQALILCLLIALVGIFGMAIPFSLTLGSLRRIDATRVGIASMLELVAGGIIAYFWLGQHLDIFQIAGCISVMIGVAILQYEGPEVKLPNNFI